MTNKNRKIKTTYYRLNDFADIKIPKWQRWTNQKNVKSLEEAVMEQGQLRPILICVLPDGTRILTDGRHLYVAMKNINRFKFAVIEVYVKDEEEARDTFISFNTKGKTLSSLDYVVSYAGGKLNAYRKFLKEVMQSPRCEKDVKDIHSKLFTVPSLINIFLGSGKSVRSGKATLPKKYDRILEIVEYLGENYLTNGVLVAQMKKNGKNMRLNGGSIIPVINKIKSNNTILNMENKDILKLLIDYTQYHYNSTLSCTFTKDAVGSSFSTYLQKENLV